jgi:hypothetical protein
MNGPDGKKYQNENVFAEIEPSTKVVVRHVVIAHFMFSSADRVHYTP